MQTICELEGAPQSVKDAVQHWFDKGYARFDAIVRELEKEDGE